MNRKELIAKARKNRMGARAAETDSRGIPEVGGAPEVDPIQKPEEGEIEEQLETAEGAPAADAPTTDMPATDTAAAPGNPSVAIPDSSAIALVKMTEQMNELAKETEINDAVIKRFNDMMKAAGLPVAAMQKMFSARATAVAHRMSSVETKRHMETVARAKRVVAAMDAETDLTTEDKTDLEEIKVSAAMAIEKAEDALAEVAAGKVGEHRNIIASAMRDVQTAAKQYAFWKKNLDFKDAVIDSITAVHEFVKAGKISAEAIFDEFDSLVSMTAAERRNIKAFKMSQTPGFVSQGISTIAGYAGREEKPENPIDRVGKLAMAAINSEKVVIDRV
jgi:hypothetical protein